MKNLLLAILLPLTTLSYGQNPNQFRFAVGSSIPLANFQETDINDINSGYAKDGRSQKVTYARSLTNQVALQFTLINTLNKMYNEPELQAYLNAVPNANYISIQNRTWDNTSILVGVSKKFNLFDSKFDLEPAISAGYSFVKRPKLFVSNHIDDPFIAQSETESTSSSLGVLFSLNSHYNIHEQLSLFVSLEYFASSPKFDFTRYQISDKNSPSTSQDISYTQDIRLFMINGGLSFSF